MDVRGKGDAAQATMALLKLAKEIADGVVGEADEATVREVFGRLCFEVDTRTAGGPASEAAGTIH